MDVLVNMSAGAIGAHSSYADVIVAHASCAVVVGVPASCAAVSGLENLTGSANKTVIETAIETATVTAIETATVTVTATVTATATAGCGLAMGRGRLLGTMCGRRAMTFPGSLFPHRQAGVRRRGSKLGRYCPCLNSDQ